MKINVSGHRLRTKYLVLAVLGGCISVIGFLVYTLHPFQQMADKLMTLQPGSLLYKLWSNPPYEVLLKMYIFNVTNSDQFLAGKEKLNLTEVGPFVYQEILRNTEGHLNENNTLTFRPRRELIPRKDLSLRDPDESIIISPNIPLLGISSYVRDNYGYFMNLGFSSVANMVDSPTMKHLTVSEYLFGYEDPLVTLASTYIPTWIDFSKFGIIDRMLALDDGDNTVTIHLSNTATNDTNDNGTPLSYSINTFNGSPGLKHWGYREDDVTTRSRCNMIEGAFDAGLFPRHLKENTTLRLYRRAFCRPVTMKYENTSYTKGGLQIYNYRLDENFLATAAENSENECYCKSKKGCLPKGFGPLAPCYYGIPISLSQPHYLNADPTILAQVNGLYPNKAKHDTAMTVNPNIGVTLSANLRIQINLEVSDNQVVSNSKPFQGLTIPLFWLELAIDEIPAFVSFLMALANAIPIIEIATACIFGLLGISLMATAWLFICYMSPHHNLEDGFDNRIGYSPILMLPLQHARSDFRRIS